jgi:hypothetical protein
MGVIMNKKDLVGRCGLYCGACVIYRAERDDPELRKRLAERWNCPVEKVRCNGCGALTPDCWGSDCKFVKCLSQKGYQFCYECPDYEAGSCVMFEEFSKNYLKDDGVDLRKNLVMIKEGKTEEWLKHSQKFYTCKFCGKPVTAGAKKCHHCKKEINLRV